MDVFISWSGQASHIVGLALKDWLPSVIQSIEPFISSEDIAKGTRWFSEIGNRLGKCNFGIICLTPDNYKEPWILFESGAISKSIDESCVAPILLGMAISELEGPIAQFNATLSNKKDVLKLVKSINDKMDITKDKKVELSKLEKIFEALWPELEEKIKECNELVKSKAARSHSVKPKRKVEDILEELIEVNRSNSRLISDLPAIIIRGQDNRRARNIGSLDGFELNREEMILDYKKLGSEILMLEDRLVSLQHKLEWVDSDLSPGLEKDCQKDEIIHVIESTRQSLAKCHFQRKRLEDMLA